MKNKFVILILFFIGLVACQWDLDCIVNEPVLPPKDNRTFCTMPSCDCPIDSFEDNQDGFIKKYTAVWIDTFGGNDRLKPGQCWMKENLNVGKKVTNSLIEMRDDGVIQKLCNEPLGGCDKIGGYYTMKEALGYSFDTVAVKGICPNGWHIPSRYEWDRLIKPLSNAEDFRKKLSVKTSGVGVDQSGTGIIVYKYDNVHTFFWSSNTDSKAIILIALFDGTDPSLVVSSVVPKTSESEITRPNSPKCVRCIKNRP
jgi:uncharacterized protein (TIGR02145 family)